MPIRLLAPEVVSKIAAGEVVERPASVVKELMENSLDAGASHVNVEVKGGGVNLIRVSDNGTGIPAGEAELAFQRHATSKLTNLADLENSVSLGFRGEALPSIAQVAGVELLTRTKDEIAGTYLSLREGKVIESSKRACSQGTTITIRGLFRNFPARLKFLKSPATENGHINEFVSHFSMAFPNVKIFLTVDGKKVLNTPGTGDVRDALVEVYGLKTAQAMLEIKGNNEGGRLVPQVDGYVSPPSISRANRSYMSFFVNRRWIQSRLLARALEKAYEGLLMRGKFPVSVVNLTLPTGWVDVNVHPTKKEVRFNQESAIFNTVHGAVRRVLTEQKSVPEYRSYHYVLSDTGQLPRIPWKLAESPAPVPLINDIVPKGMPILRILGQLASTYVITEGPDGLYLIDQHAAHERILFERIFTQKQQRKLEIQPLLEPQSIELDVKQEEILRANWELVTEFGFTVEPFGDRTFLLRAAPALLGGVRLGEALKEVLDSLREQVSINKIEEKIAISLACHNAIRAGKNLSHEEMVSLIQELEKTDLPRTCPHGRPTMVHISSRRLESEFGRS